MERVSVNLARPTTIGCFDEGAVEQIMLAVINKITTVKVTAAEEEMGLDETLHGEHAYI